ncbi:hypothetical protein [Holzapfeliella floricola]|uniref:hypothetical protein n=1 Tax=Holzapfeliella floricola TaxID=679249 RepID=UPI000782479C|nr:hypothetical protein [Holzapfeliella floricola]
MKKTKEALDEKESELTQKDDKIDSLKDKVTEVKEAVSSQKKSKPWWKNLVKNNRILVCDYFFYPLPSMKAG